MGPPSLLHLSENARLPMHYPRITGSFPQDHWPLGVFFQDHWEFSPRIIGSLPQHHWKFSLGLAEWHINHLSVKLTKIKAIMVANGHYVMCHLEWHDTAWYWKAFNMKVAIPPLTYCFISSLPVADDAEILVLTFSSNVDRYRINPVVAELFTLRIKQQLAEVWVPVNTYCLLLV